VEAFQGIEVEEVDSHHAVEAGLGCKGEEEQAEELHEAEDGVGSAREGQSQKRTTKTHQRHL
jgi:hypothetical protein